MVKRIFVCVCVYVYVCVVCAILFFATAGGCTVKNVFVLFSRELYIPLWCGTHTTLSISRRGDNPRGLVQKKSVLIRIKSTVCRAIQVLMYFFFLARNEGGMKHS